MPATNALAYAFEQFPDATFTVLYASDLASGEGRIMAGGSFGSWKTEQETFASNLFETANEGAADRGLSIQTIHEFGEPTRKIIEISETEDIDLIVI